MALAVGIEVRQELGDLRRLSRGRKRHMRAAWKRIAGRMMRIQRRAFRSESTPWGRGWPPHSEATIALRRRGGFSGRQRKGRRGTKILQRTGRLKRSMKWRPFTDKVKSSVTGPARRYAHVHLFGNPRNRLPNNASGNPAPIPARPAWPVVLRGGRPQPRIPRQDRKYIVDTLRAGYFGLGQGARR